jgi:hypothetical protein
MRVITAAALLAAVTVAASTFAPIAQADGDPSNLDQLIGQTYTKFQNGCTPGMTPRFQRVVWDHPPTGQGGTGHVIDADPSLGGQIKVTWNSVGGPTREAKYAVPAQPSGYWDIAFEFC